MAYVLTNACITEMDNYTRLHVRVMDWFGLTESHFVAELLLIHTPKHLEVLVHIGVVRMKQSEYLHQTRSSEGLNLSGAMIMEEGH